MKAGHCTACQGQCWRGLIRPDTQEWVHLFPEPTSMYAVLQTPEGLAVGLAYHAACAPKIGDAGPSVLANGRSLGPTTVVRLDPAPARYTYWFSPGFGTWLRAWTRQLAMEFRVPVEQYDALLVQWEQDRAQVPPMPNVAETVNG